MLPYQEINIHGENSKSHLNLCVNMIFFFFGVFNTSKNMEMWSKHSNQGELEN